MIINNKDLEKKKWEMSRDAKVARGKMFPPRARRISREAGTRKWKKWKGMLDLEYFDLPPRLFISSSPILFPSCSLFHRILYACVHTATFYFIPWQQTIINWNGEQWIISSLINQRTKRHSVRVIIRYRAIRAVEMQSELHNNLWNNNFKEYL